MVKRVRDHFYRGKIDCLGGKIGVRLESEPPFAIDEKMMWFFCTTTLGENGRFLTYPEHPNGGNMAFNAKVFDEVGGFDTNLKLYGDETEFFRRVSVKGFAVYYDPEVEAVQVIPSNRLTKDELRYKSAVRGRGAAAVWLLSGPGKLKRIAQIGEFSLRVAYMRLRLLTDTTFGKFFTYWFYRGYLNQLLKGPEVS